MRKTRTVLIIFLLLVGKAYTQNETKKWCFGNNAGLDFMTNPPTSFTNAMNPPAGCASIADAAGNLLFYTNGATLWNQSHTIMANGAGLFGNTSNAQSSLIIKKPGTNRYYVFTTASGSVSGLYYHLVDMNLAAGMGSVTVKNSLLYAPVADKLTAVSHCNGKDVWIVSHDENTNEFISLSFDSVGSNINPVLSVAGITYTTPTGGQMKLSPNGKKLAVVHQQLGKVELFDFDNTTGVVSNDVVLSNTLTGAFGCEFSPNGSKLYVTSGLNALVNKLHQWDICVGTNSQIIASQTLIASTPPFIAGLQLAANGKLYVSPYYPQPAALGVINSPNLSGAACNYVSNALPAFPSGLCLPNFVTSSFRAGSPPPFNYITYCQNAVFTGSTSCATANQSFVSARWDFGDPASGSDNTALTLNCSHIFSSTGTYNVKLVLNYNCYSDTVKQIVSISIPGPTFAISGPSSICVGDRVILTASPALICSWQGIAGTYTPIAHWAIVSPTVNASYIVIGTDALSGCQSKQMINLAVNKCLGVEGQNGFVNGNLQVWPNPVQDILTIEAENEVFPMDLNIVDISGRQVKNFVIEHNTQVPLHTLPRGFYFVEFRQQTKLLYSQKLIKE